MSSDVLMERARQIVASGGVEHLDGTRYRVASQSGAEPYQVDLNGQTCTCPFRVQHFTCKHVLAAQLSKGGVVAIQAVVDQAKAPAKSLLKSALQKNVRRGRVGPAVRVALALAGQDWVGLIRRLPIIAMEDVFLPPFYDEMVEKMSKTGSKSFVPMAVDLKQVAEWAGWMAAQVVRDAHREAHRPECNGAFYEAANQLSERQRELVRALALRSNYGGMQADVEMLRDFAWLWLSRPASCWDRVFGARSSEPMMDAEMGPLRPGDILPQAVDMHCSPIVGILVKKETIAQLVRRVYGQQVQVNERLEWVLWCRWASWNLKLDWEKDRMWDFAVDRVEDPSEASRVDAIWHEIGAEVERVARWWLNKN